MMVEGALDPLDGPARQIISSQRCKFLSMRRLRAEREDCGSGVDIAWIERANRERHGLSRVS